MIKPKRISEIRSTGSRSRFLGAGGGVAFIRAVESWREERGTEFARRDSGTLPPWRGVHLGLTDPMRVRGGASGCPDPIMRDFAPPGKCCLAGGRVSATDP
jgi:hypothetical protein